jgi:hypothetical protein
MVTERRQEVGKRAFPGRQVSVSLPGLRLEVTWENDVEHSGSLCLLTRKGPEVQLCQRRPKIGSPHLPVGSVMVRPEQHR